MPALLVAAMVVFLEGFSFGVMLPVLSPFARQLGGDETWAGLLFALATAPRIIFAPLWGRLSDRWGRRGSLAMVSTGTMAGSLLWAVCQPLGALLWSGLVWLLISRAVYGVFAAQSVLGLAVASDISEPKRRAAAMGVLGAAFGLAFTIGPGVGGWFAETYSLADVGYLAAAAQLLSIALILSALRETRPDRGPATGPTRLGSPFARSREWDPLMRPASLLRLGRRPAIAALLTATIVSTIAYSVMIPTFQPIAERWYGWSEQAAGWALSLFGLIGFIVQGLLVGPAARGVGEKGAAIGGLLVLGVGLATVAAHPGVGGFWVATVLMAIGAGFTVPSITALLSLRVGQHEQGAAHGLNQSGTSIGRAGGYLLGGALYAEISPASAYLAGTAAALLCLIGLATLRAGAPLRQEKIQTRGNT